MAWLGLLLLLLSVAGEGAEGQEEGKVLPKEYVEQEQEQEQEEEVLLAHDSWRDTTDSSQSGSSESDSSESHLHTSDLFQDFP